MPVPRVKELIYRYTGFVISTKYISPEVSKVYFLLHFSSSQQINRIFVQQDFPLASKTRGVLKIYTQQIRDIFSNEFLHEILI